MYSFVSFSSSFGTNLGVVEGFLISIGLNEGVGFSVVESNFGATGFISYTLLKIL